MSLLESITVSLAQPRLLGGGGRPRGQGRPGARTANPVASASRDCGTRPHMMADQDRFAKDGELSKKIAMIFEKGNVKCTQGGGGRQIV